MYLKIAGLILVITSGILGLLSKKLLPVFLKREAKESDILKSKLIFFSMAAIGALAVVLSK